MLERPLERRRFLVVEDEYLIAAELLASLEDAGATVFGPVSDLDRALEIATANFPIDGAVLDINLQSKMVYPAAEKLADQKIPLVFVTGYECRSIPSQFAGYPCLTKPINERELIQLLASTKAVDA